MLHHRCLRPSFLAPFIVFLAVIVVFTSAPLPQPSSMAPRGALARFTSQGHALAFGADAFVLTNAAYALRVQFIGANTVMPRAQETSQRSVAMELSQVEYENLWDGISLTYDRGGGILRSTYCIEPNANPNAIRLQYNAPVTLNADGTLTTVFETGQLTESAPIAWQEIDGQRVAVEVQWRSDTHASVISEPSSASGLRSPISGLQSPISGLTFNLGAYDSSYPLYIDPTITWNTFLGGSDYDSGQGIAVDADGNVYIAGSSGATWGSPLRAYTANGDAFVAKLDSSGALVWHTFLGGSGSDRAGDVAVDEDGNIYVGGVSDATWGTSPAPIRAFTASEDGWVAKLNSSGARQWHTFLGGNSYDSVGGVAVDPYGNVYAGGNSRATWGSPLRAHDLGENDDAFAAKLASNGALTWHTFLGGSDADYGSDIAVDVNQIVYLAGYSEATWGSPLRAISTEGDAFAVRLEADGSIDWNTFLGGTGYDYGKGVGFDFFGNVYVAGNSDATWGSPLNPHDPGANQDFFAALLDIDGALQWNTFVGGSGSEYAYGFAVEGYGTHYIMGESVASFGSPVRPYTADDDALVAKLDINGTLAWHTFLGGAEDDDGERIAINGTDVYAVGSSRETWASPVRAHDAGDNTDAFVAKLSPPANDAFANAESISGTSGSISGSTHYATKETEEPNHANFPGGASVWYQWTPGSGVNVTFDTLDSPYDTLLAVYTGSPVNGLTEVASNDDCSVPASVNSCLTFNAVGGTTYRIAVDGILSAMGNIELNWSSCATKPAKPTVTKPNNNGIVTMAKVQFKWNLVPCATSYKLIIKDALTGQKVLTKTLPGTTTKTKVSLPAGSYKGSVIAINAIGKTKSKAVTFTKQ